MKHVLFVDIRNAIRSPIAEAWFNHLADGCGVAASCGTMPANEIDPRAARVMQEVSLSIQDKTRRVDQQTLARADIVVLMGQDIHPHAFAPTYIWDFQESGDQSIVEMRFLRDHIRQKVQRLIAEIQMEDLDTITTAVQWQTLMQYILSR